MTDLKAVTSNEYSDQEYDWAVKLARGLLEQASLHVSIRIVGLTHNLLVRQLYIDNANDDFDTDPGEVA